MGFYATQSNHTFCTTYFTTLVVFNFAIGNWKLFAQKPAWGIQTLNVSHTLERHDSKNNALRTYESVTDDDNFAQN